MNRKLSDVHIVVNETGIVQVLVFSDNHEEAEDALCLLAGVAEELKALRKKLRNPAPLTAENIIAAKFLLEGVNLDE